MIIMMTCMVVDCWHCCQNTHPQSSLIWCLEWHASGLPHLPQLMWRCSQHSPSAAGRLLPGRCQSVVCIHTQASPSLNMGQVFTRHTSVYWVRWLWLNQWCCNARMNIDPASSAECLLIYRYIIAAIVCSFTSCKTLQRLIPRHGLVWCTWPLWTTRTRKLLALSPPTVLPIIRPCRPTRCPLTTVNACLLERALVRSSSRMCLLQTWPVSAQ